jgi:hypothetical protein
MQHSLWSTLILCAIVFQLLGCSENADIEMTETEEVDVTPVETPTPETLFERLQNQFAGRLENWGNFTALRNITTSQTYLDYLAEVYPTERHVKTLEEYFQAAPPDAERYTLFLKKWIDSPTEEDIAIMHRITTAYREANIILFNVFHLPKREEIGQNIALIFEKKLGVIAEPATEVFLRRHQIQIDEFAAPLEEFVLATEIEDAIWLHEQMEAHGTDSGLLWSAIHKPALIGEVLQNFSSTDHFLKWINITRVRK